MIMTNTQIQWGNKRHLSSSNPKLCNTIIHIYFYTYIFLCLFEESKNLMDYHL